MNFLAHLHLGRHTPEFLLGSLLGDFVRGRVEDDQFTPEIREGIRVHRSIDGFTDNNTYWKTSKYRLPKPLRRYAGIIVDVFYDHLLMLHWQKYADFELTEFIHLSNRAVQSGREHLHPEWYPFFDRFVSEDWLTSYGTMDGIGIALKRISKRSTRLAPMAGSEMELKKNFVQFEEDFLTFYPEALVFAGSILNHEEA